MFTKPIPIPPQPGQESVWDYPRPPRLEATPKQIQVIFNQVLIADTHGAWRVLETSHPPVYYLPLADIRREFLHPATGSSWCEWKGSASYYTLSVNGREAVKAAWYYSHPTPAFRPIAGYVAFYAGLMDSCTVDGVVVQPQPGHFYGGWITPDVVGPFKGQPGTSGW